jgi:hypothetical protein
MRSGALATRLNLCVTPDATRLRLTGCTSFRPKRFKTRPVDQATPTVSSALKMWAKGPGLDENADEEEEEAFGSTTNLVFNLELLLEAVVDVDLRAKAQAKHQGVEAEVLGDQLHDARIRLGKNPGVFTDPDESAWDAISTLYGKQTQLEEGLVAGVDHMISQRIGASLSALATTMDNEIKVKVEAAVAPLRVERGVMERELLACKARLTKMGARVASSLPGPSFQDDWMMVIEFFSRHTLPRSNKIGDKIDVALTPGAGGMGTGLIGNGSTSGGAAIGTLQKEMQDLRDRLVSTCVTMGKHVFPTLEYTTKWTTLELPEAPDAALICVDAVTLFHSIGTEFSTTSETRDQIYQNKKAGLSTLSLILHSSFQTSLPQVFGSKNLVGGEDKWVLLPCAKTYSEWYSDNDGIVSGVKPRIEEGLKAQINLYQGAIEEVSYTHPAAAIIATTMLDISAKLCDAILILIDKMTTEHAARHGEVKPEESWLQVSAIVRQVFRELRKVRQKGAGAFNSISPTHLIGQSWWYVLQTHLKMEQFMATKFWRHPAITPVFTSHLDLFRVTKSAHHALENNYKTLKSQVGVLDASVKRLQGARGNNGGRGATPTLPP